MIIIKEKTLERIKDWEDSSIYVLADFDKTITSGNSESSWSILSKNNIMPKKYDEEAKTFYNYYRSFEIDETLDFETSEELDLEILYRYSPYMSWTCSEPLNNVDYIGNDEKNAYDGTGYLRIKGYEFAYGSNGHSFVLYDKNNPSGLMILEPNSNYRITAQSKYEDDASVPSLKVWFVDPTTLDYTRKNNFSITTTNDDMMGYDEISGVITTGDTPVAVALGGVYLAEQDVYIDNLKVEKLLEATIKFETYGGDPIEDVKVLPYSELTSYDPGFAFKPGYEFIGWYLDKEFTKPFDFLTDYVTGDITLYAKFVEEVWDDEKDDDFEEDFVDTMPEDSSNDTTSLNDSTTSDESLSSEDIYVDDLLTNNDLGNVNNSNDIIEETSQDFGEQLIVSNADPIGKTDAIESTIEESVSPNVWIIVGIVVASIIALGGTTLLVIWLIRRKKV